MGRHCCPKTGIDIAKTKSVLTRVCTLLAIGPLIFGLFCLSGLVQDRKDAKDQFWVLLMEAIDVVDILPGHIVPLRLGYVPVV